MYKNKEFGKFLRAKRLEKGLKSGQMAKLLDISLTWYSQIELGKQVPSIPLTLRISHELKVSYKKINKLIIRD